MFQINTCTKPSKILFAFILIILILIQSDSFSQSFIKITDPGNPIVTDVMSGQFFGASWVDIDNDGKLDLFVNSKAVYKNLGGGNFTKLLTAMGDQTPNIGNSWADYNNDGFIDCFVIATGAPNSFLYKNYGGDVINKITSGEIGDSLYNSGWGCAWADYDNDGYVDLFMTAANNFGIVHHPNRLYHNNGNESFTRVNFPGLTDTLAPFTIATWSDYDQDGDMDLFIGTGPGGSTSQDYFYKNTLMETGTANLIRLALPPLTTDPHDGQNWNWIDYDNDGDLDGFVTNYSSVPNELYRNNNDGTFERMTTAQVGNIVGELGNHLTNLWADFDNDGDLDCFITRGGQSSRYYTNNGNGTFTKIDTTVIVSSIGCYGASAGDYDNNGTVDLYVTGSTNSKGLYKNVIDNGNKWVNIKCTGGGALSNLSNMSAIGAKVKVKAVINGVPVWQLREVSSQNSFNSMNMLNVHFGLGNASVIDSLVIIWPKGLKEVFTNVSVNNFYNATEGQGIVSGISNSTGSVPDGFALSQNYPNPFNPSTVISYQLTNSDNVILKVYDILGNEITTLVNGKQPAGNYQVTFDGRGLSSGIYFYKLSAGGFSDTKKMNLIK